MIQQLPRNYDRIVSEQILHLESEQTFHGSDRQIFIVVVVVVVIVVIVIVVIVILNIILITFENLKFQIMSFIGWQNSGVNKKKERRGNNYCRKNICIYLYKWNDKSIFY